MEAQNQPKKQPQPKSEIDPIRLEKIKKMKEKACKEGKIITKDA